MTTPQSLATARAAPPKPGNPPLLQSTNAIYQYTNSMGALGQMVGGRHRQPRREPQTGGASSHSISMNERFARPLVIGYIAQDYPILEDNRPAIRSQPKDAGRTYPRPAGGQLSAALPQRTKAAAAVANQSISKLGRLTADQSSHPWMQQSSPASSAIRTRGSDHQQDDHRPKAAFRIMSQHDQRNPVEATSGAPRSIGISGYGNQTPTLIPSCLTIIT